MTIELPQAKQEQLDALVGKIERLEAGMEEWKDFYEFYREADIKKSRCIRWIGELIYEHLKEIRIKEKNK